MSTKLISIIILTYKQGDYLYETLDSIFVQDYKKIEIVIAEDGDPHFDFMKVEKYILEHAGENIVNVLFSINKENVGTVKNINNAIKKATGEYIKIIAGDDVYPNSSVLSKQINLLDEKKCDLVVGNLIECDEELNEIEEIGFARYGMRNILNNRDALLRFVCRYHPQVMATQAICYKRSFLIKQKGFDERFKFIEDLPMAVKIITTGADVGYVDWACVKHRGKVGISTSKDLFDIKRISYFYDLKKYFELILKPYKDIIGTRYVEARIKLYEFRIKYATVPAGIRGKIMKCVLIVEYACPLLYYFIVIKRRS